MEAIPTKMINADIYREREREIVNEWFMLI